MKVLFFLSLLMFSLSTFPCDVDLCTRTSGAYKAFIKTNRDNEGYTENRTFFIKQNGKTIYSEVSFDQIFFGDSMEDPSKYVIKDLNGNGIPDLVTTKYTGGSRCCYILNIYELGPTLKRIFSIETNQHGYEIKDINHDGLYEILFRDPVLGCEGSEFYHCPTSASGLVIVEWIKNGYKVSSRLMKKNPLRFYASAIYDKGMFDVDFIQYMADMSYSGNMEQAFKKIAVIWPKSHSDFLEFKKKFISILNSSSYWKEFQNSLKTVYP
jgi:hypothetical protein